MNTEFHLSIRSADPSPLDDTPLTAADVEAAIKSAMISKLGWSITHQLLASSDLKIVVS